MPVITAFEFDDFISAGIPPGEPHGTHGGFSAGVHHADHFDRRDQPDNLLCEFIFQVSGSAKTGTVCQNNFKVLNDFSGGMTKNQRSPGADVIDVFLTVFIPDQRSIAPF